MPTVFLSYSHRDHFFAELAAIKLREAGIELWRDQDKIRVGTDWKYEIERGISECIAVVVVLSNYSAESSYVTFEWAYGLGKAKPIIPVKLNDCSAHQRLQTIQQLDFSVPGSLPWESLIERIKEIEIADMPKEETKPTAVMAETASPSLPENTVQSIWAYLNQHGYQMVSFDRLRQLIDNAITDAQFNEMIAKNSAIFRSAHLKGNKPGLAKIVP